MALPFRLPQTLGKFCFSGRNSKVLEHKCPVLRLAMFSLLGRGEPLNCTRCSVHFSLSIPSSALGIFLPCIEKRYLETSDHKGKCLSQQPRPKQHTEELTIRSIDTQIMNWAGITVFCNEFSIFPASPLCNSLHCTLWVWVSHAASASKLSVSTPTP